MSSPSDTRALSLYEAVSIAVDSNPEIGEAIARREAIEFELRQGRGLYLPSVDVEGKTGFENRDNRTTRANNDDDHVFFRNEATLSVTQMLFDGFATDAEVERHASRVDASSFRILERSEFIGLSVVREYLDIIRHYNIVKISLANLQYHEKVLGDIREGTDAGTVSIADRDQAQERLVAARTRLIEAREDLNAAKIRFNRLVGRPVGSLRRPRSVRHSLPKTLAQAIGLARTNNPSVKLANADIDTAYAQVKAAESRFYPKITVEGQARAGHNLDGVRGRDTDLQANLVARWNLYRGGIDTANREEQVRVVDQRRMELYRVHREVEEAMRLSWDRANLQRQRLGQLLQQRDAVDNLLNSYSEQFKVGQRSLLDLLDTQNTRVRIQVAVATTDAAAQFADYRILAASGILLNTLSIKPPSSTKAYARDQADVPETPPAETMKRHSPDRDSGWGLY